MLTDRHARVRGLAGARPSRDRWSGGGSDLNQAETEDVAFLQTPAWRRCRDAFLRLFVVRMDEGGRPGFGDDADGRFLRAVSDLPREPPAGPADGAGAALRDLGHAAGTHVYGVLIEEDDVDHAVAEVSHALETSGWGGLEIASRFHRELDLRPTSPEGGDPPARSHRTAFVAGVLEGALARGFNVPVDVEVRDGSFAVELRSGANVPPEGSHGR